MPTEDYQKHEDFDDSAQPGAKRQLVKLVVWWDCKRFRRFSKALVGFPDPQWIYSVIPLAFKQGVHPYLSTAVMLPEKTWMAHLQRAKQDKAYAEVKNAGRDPDINQYESELIKEIGRRVIYNAQGEPMPTLVLPPDHVKHRFVYE